MCIPSFLNCCSRVQNQSTAQVIPLTKHPVDTSGIIKSVYERGLFAPFKDVLSTQIKSYHWNQTKTTWWDHICTLANEGSSQAAPSKSEELLCLLFAVALDPEISKESKKTTITNLLSNLEKNLSESVFYELGFKLPPAISATILHHSETTVWESAFSTILRLRISSETEDIFYNWFEEITTNNWSSDEKNSFLDTFFSTLPNETSENLVCYFLIEANESLKKQLPRNLSKRANLLNKEIAECAHSLLKNQNIRIGSIPYQDYKRKYFLEHFVQNLSHPRASLIAVRLDEKDWKWLRARLEPKIPVAQSFSSGASSTPARIVPHAMKWMIEIAKRLQNGKNNESSSKIWLFFRYASYQIKEGNDWKNISEGEVEGLAKALTPESLFHYLEPLEKTLRNKLTYLIAKNEPKKFISWLKIIVEACEHHQEQAQEKISSIFSSLSTEGYLRETLGIIFDRKQTNHELTLSIFCALNQKFRKEILAYLLQEKTTGMSLLKNWFGLSLKKPDLRAAFASNFYPLLQEIDPALAPQLKRKLEEAFPAEQETITLLLPVDYEGTSQEQAIQKLKNLFLTKNTSYAVKNEAAQTIQKEIEGNEEPIEWLPKLFKELPKETWPLIFLYFQGYTFDSSCFDPSDAPHGLPRLKKGIKNPVWTKNTEEWVDLAVTTLQQLPSTPCLQEKNESISSIREILHVADQTNTLKEVFQHLIETSSPELFIAIMNIYSEEKFIEPLSIALEESNVNKTLFIAKCLKAQHNSGASPASRADLEKSLWKPPFIKNDQEMGQLAKHLAGETEFLAIFSQWNTPKVELINSLKSTDIHYCQKLFLDSVRTLCLSKKDESIRFHRFEILCEAYFAAGLNPLELLPDELMPTVQKWYKVKEHITQENASLRLLRHFNEKAFIPTLFQKMEAFAKQVKSQSTLFSLESLFKQLKQLGCLSEIIDQLNRKQIKIRSLIEKKFKHNPADVFYYSLPHCSSLACQLIPNWKEQLTTWVEKEIQKEKVSSMKGRGRPNYFHIVTLYQSLEKTQLLESFLRHLEVKLSSNFKEELQDIQTEFKKKSNSSY